MEHVYVLFEMVRAQVRVHSTTTVAVEVRGRRSDPSPHPLWRVCVAAGNICRTRRRAAGHDQPGAAARQPAQQGWRRIELEYMTKLIWSSKMHSSPVYDGEK